METRTALVVDDDSLEREYMSELLRRNALTVRSTATIPNASGMAKGMYFDCVFIDELMPGTDPASSLDEIRGSMQSRDDDRQLFILMGDASERSAGEYESYGYHGFLEKPVDPTALKEILSPEAVEKESGDPLYRMKDLNVDTGISNCGSRENYLSALKIFHDTHESKANEIRNFFKSGDIKNYTVKVHALKSSARIIGAGVLSDAAKRLEDAGNAGNIDEINRDTAKLLDMYDRIGVQLGSLFEEEEPDKPLVDDATIADAYRSMGEFAKLMDYDLVKMVLDSVTREFSLRKDDEERFKRIKEALMKLDWDTVSAEAAADES